MFNGSYQLCNGHRNLFYVCSLNSFFIIMGSFLAFLLCVDDVRDGKNLVKNAYLFLKSFKPLLNFHVANKFRLYSLEKRSISNKI
jgi:hypothetical protein